MVEKLESAFVDERCVDHISFLQERPSLPQRIPRERNFSLLTHTYTGGHDDYVFSPGHALLLYEENHLKVDDRIVEDLADQGFLREAGYFDSIFTKETRKYKLTARGAKELEQFYRG